MTTLVSRISGKAPPPPPKRSVTNESRTAADATGWPPALSGVKRTSKVALAPTPVIAASWKNEATGDAGWLGSAALTGRWR